MEGTHRYAIETSMPLGRRRGTLEIHILEQSVNGVLDLLGRLNPFQAGVYRDGQLFFSGQLITPLYILQYNASGRISESRVEFDMETRKGRLHTTGVAIAPKGHNAL